MKNKLTVVITTHAGVVGSPSTKIIDQTIGSMIESCPDLAECDFWIMCDYNSVKIEEFMEYSSNLKRMMKTYELKYVVWGRENSGLKDNYLKAITSISTPYLFMSEHDWNFEQKFEIKEIIEAMDKSSRVNFVKFSKRPNMVVNIDWPEEIWETIAIQDEEFSFLTKTNSFATHPHVIRVSKFLNHWMPLRPGDNSLKSIEWTLYTEYQKDIAVLGFEEAHRKWGCFNYGSISADRYIVHLDGSNSGRK
jgi:hypothetical protein